MKCKKCGIPMIINEWNGWVWTCFHCDNIDRKATNEEIEKKQEGLWYGAKKINTTKEETMEKIYISKESMKALNHAIDVKWYGVCFKGGKDDGTDDCELCVLYYASGCRDCPIREYTGHAECTGTPYTEWRDCFEYDETRFADTPKKMRAALDFYEWLIGLREKCEVVPSPWSARCCSSIIVGGGVPYCSKCGWPLKKGGVRRIKK